MFQRGRVCTKRGRTNTLHCTHLPGRGDEGGHQAYEIVVHVARAAQRGGGGSHHGGHQKVQLVHRGVLQLQPAHRQCCVLLRRCSCEGRRKEEESVIEVCSF